MPNVRQLASHRNGSFRIAMSSLYTEIDAFGSGLKKSSKKNLTEDEIKCRIMFFRRMRGRLIQVFRLKNGLSASDVAEKMNWSAGVVEKIEAGESALSDPQFFKLCDFLGASGEISKFFDKMEEALHPHIGDARSDLVETLKSYGFNIARSEKAAGAHLLRFPSDLSGFRD